jgi:hypothetical protein
MEEKKDSMLIRKVVEQVLEVGHDLDIENISIGKNKYTLHIRNGINPNSKRGFLYLTFEYKDKNGKPEEYGIDINEEGIEFRKGIWDEGDMDSTEGIEHRNLLVKIEGKEKGKLFWGEYSPSMGEAYFKAPFIEEE